MMKMTYQHNAFKIRDIDGLEPLAVGAVTTADAGHRVTQTHAHARHVHSP